MVYGSIQGTAKTVIVAVGNPVLFPLGMSVGTRPGYTGYSNLLIVTIFKITEMFYCLLIFIKGASQLFFRHGSTSFFDGSSSTGGKRPIQPA
jgi:hypothetical protein